MDIQEIKNLSQAKKIVLVQDIWEDIDKDSLELTDAMKAELDRRLERHEKGEGQYYSLDEAKTIWAKKRQ